MLATLKAFFQILHQFNGAAVGTTFNVFSYDTAWVEHWSHYLPGRRAEALHVMPRTRVLISFNMNVFFIVYVVEVMRIKVN